MFRGERLKYLRKQKNMTQEDLAKELNLKRSTVSSMEANRITPPLKTLETLMKLFDVSIDYFLEEILSGSNELPFIIPRKFSDRNVCMDYLSSHEGLNKLCLEKLTDDELINFSNEIQEYIETLSYKYKR